MNIQEFLIASQYKITEGSNFGWNCYGNNVYCIDCYSNFENVTASCIFNTKTQEVYEVHLFLEEQSYRWLNPNTKEALYEESFKNDLDPRCVYEDEFYKDCEVESDILEKLTTLFETGTCKNDIVIDIPIELVEALKLEEGQSLDEFVSQIIIDECEKLEARHNKNWNYLKENLKELDIEVTVNQIIPLSVENIAEIQGKIINSNEKSLNFTYKNKLTVDGLIQLLISDNLTIEYML